MSSSIAQVKKLRGRRLREIRARGRQELTKLGERLIRSGTAEMSDEAFLARVNPAARDVSAEGTGRMILESIRADLKPAGGGKADRTRPAIFSHPASRSEIKAIIHGSFPHEREAIIKRAERAIEGRFDLLGFEGIRFGPDIDWHLEPESGLRLPAEEAHNTVTVEGQSQSTTAGAFSRGSFEVAGQIKLQPPAAFRWCALGVSGGRVEITIHGAGRFDLSFNQPPRTTLVNKAPFEMSRNRPTAAFVRSGPGGDWPAAIKGLRNLCVEFAASPCRKY